MTPISFAAALDLLIQTTSDLGERANQTDDAPLAGAVTTLLRVIAGLHDVMESVSGDFEDGT